ncbi:MAG TPA: carboxylesterase/lipase family protein [Amycolatopsis sp.]|nr:carboxylesterase/lipase family protein [Amycolatopsis sp.]
MRTRSGEQSKWAAVLVLLLVLTTACSAGAAAAPQGDIVSTRDGVLRGVVASDHRTFSGIPFAAPPVGDLRWRSPAPVKPWSGVRDATRPASTCAQPDLSGKLIGSEDCLYLNVNAPVDASSPRPVMVWLYGGGFVSGTGSDYDPTRLVEQGVVVVTLNYRLGALGFLDGVDDPASGNFGLADQQAALRWVRDNIAAFGGDPNNVTLFGQSAGAFSVCAQLASPQAHGLFQKAIIQSGPCADPFVTGDVAKTRDAQWAAGLGCADIACLRSKPLSAVVAVDQEQVVTPLNRVQDLPWEPVAGTALLPTEPMDALRQGAAKGIPIIQGTTRDELRSFVANEYNQRGQPLTAAEYPVVVGQVFGANASAVLAEYPLDHYPSPGVALATLLTDWGQKVGSCPALATDDVASQSTAVYAYEFAQDSGTSVAGFELGASHSGELPYLFGPPNELSQKMIGYWTSFAKTGDPGWPRYSDGKVLSLGLDMIGEVDFGADHHCSFWSGHSS